MLFESILMVLHIDVYMMWFNVVVVLLELILVITFNLDLG